MTEPDTTNNDPTPKHYARRCACGAKLDPYRISEIYGLNSMAHHLVKKGLCAGDRGHKDLEEDLRNIIATATRWLEMLKEDEQTVEDQEMIRIHAQQPEQPQEEDIESRIKDFDRMVSNAIGRFQRENGHEPTILSLGKKEMSLFLEITRRGPSVPRTREDREKGPLFSYRGLTLHPIHAESSICVS